MPTLASTKEPSHEIMMLFVLRKLILQCVCAAIQWRYMSDNWSDPSSTSILHVYEQPSLWRDSADAQAHLSLRWSPMC